MQVSPQLKTLIDGLAEDFKPMVESIEQSTPTTKDHYGRYMSLLSSLGKGEKKQSMLFAMAMMQAGGNRAGIASAMKILFG